MRYTILLCCFYLSLFSCKPTTENNTSTVKPKFPSNVEKVFDAHGGYDTWKEMKAMIYTIKNDKGDEKQFIDLEDRREKIEGKDYTMGYDGTQYWVDADTSLKKNPVFYTNLMMYFYAMPFVVSDPGIQYTDVAPFQHDGKSYPGFKVSYDAGVGISPEDEYYIYYNSETFQMEWLAYTVTYFSKEKSEKLGWIKYDDWMAIEGLTLPASLTWYKVEENKPIAERNRRYFDKIILSKNKMKDDTFTPTQNAKIVEAG